MGTSRLDVVPERVRCAPDGDPIQDEAACALLRGPVSFSCDAADTTVAPDEFPRRPAAKMMMRSANERAELDQELGPQAV